MTKTATIAAPQTFSWQGARLFPAALCILIGLGIALLPCPSTLEPASWRLFGIFVATIVGMITKPLPLGPVVLCGTAVALCTHSAHFDKAFGAYSQEGIWLIVLSFFLAKSLIKSRLALRVSFHLISRFGQTTLGLAYAILGAELLLCPFVPSLIARSGGILFPITFALAQQQVSVGSSDTRTAGFLMLCGLHGSLICSNMFLTAMAANPICVQMAADSGIHIDWNTWALAASVPGIVSLLTVPYLLYRLSPPSALRTPEAPKLARERLDDLGPVSVNECITLGIFSVVLVLWIFGPSWGISSTTGALLGLSALIFAGVLSWKDCLEETTGWDTLIWMGAIIGLGNQLRELGFFDWLSQASCALLPPCHWSVGFLAVSLLYFYSHYLFASNIAHATSMFYAFYAALVGLGTPAFLAFFTLSFFNNIFGGLTHYASGPAPLYFSTGYVSLGRWWTVGLIVGTYNIIIWLGLGSLWWSYIGLW